LVIWYVNGTPSCSQAKREYKDDVWSPDHSVDGHYDLMKDMQLEKANRLTVFKICSYISGLYSG